jgi:hypothetical protein
MAYRRPTLQQAFLWGLTGGAGFALAEGLFNSLGGLEEWATIVLLRVGATLLHCFAGALMGLAWYAVLAERRWGRALTLYAGAVCTHGLWNTLAAAMAYISLRTVDDSRPALEPSAAQMGMAAIPALLAGMALAIAVGLIVATRYARCYGAQQPLPRRTTRRRPPRTGSDEYILTWWPGPVEPPTVGSTASDAARRSGQDGRRSRCPWTVISPDTGSSSSSGSSNTAHRCQLWTIATVSGVSRGDQRRLYDLRRQEWAGANGLVCDPRLSWVANGGQAALRNLARDRQVVAQACVADVLTNQGASRSMDRCIGRPASAPSVNSSR